eukprot:scaffold307529_cov38-Prasinocladus_malaysianus.AAC.1
MAEKKQKAKAGSSLTPATPVYNEVQDKSPRGLYVGLAIGAVPFVLRSRSDYRSRISPLGSLELVSRGGRVEARLSTADFVRPRTSDANEIRSSDVWLRTICPTPRARRHARCESQPVP